MAVKKTFWEDPYLDEIQATVTSANNNIITLDKTIAYAFSGGQASDSGTIGGKEIIDAKKIGKEIFYTLPEGHGLKTKDKIDVKINWSKRYRLMRLHFAAELILELVYENYNHAEKIGANITEDKARVDFYWQGNISRIFPDVIERFDFIVKSDLPIFSGFEDEDAETRYWEIDCFAKVPCGGTHLRKTGEIGSIFLKRNNIGNGKERIEIYLQS